MGAGFGYGLVPDSDYDGCRIRIRMGAEFGLGTVLDPASNPEAHCEVGSNVGLAFKFACRFGLQWTIGFEFRFRLDYYSRFGDGFGVELGF